MKKIILVCLVTAILVSGCGKNKESNLVNDTSATEVITSKPLVVEQKSDAIEVGTKFKDPIENGNLYYTINSCNVYKKLSEAGIHKDDIIDPHNSYNLEENKDKYQDMSKFFASDGDLTEDNQLVVLDVTIENKDAIGMIKKIEFSTYDLCLYAGNPATTYYPAYFSEAGKADKEQPFHYDLEQGQTLKVKLAYLILKDDVKNLIGMIDQTQFKIYQ